MVGTPFARAFARPVALTTLRVRRVGWAKASGRDPESKRGAAALL
jgi:hypothetical protein